MPGDTVQSTGTVLVYRHSIRYRYRKDAGTGQGIGTAGIGTVAGTDQFKVHAESKVHASRGNTISTKGELSI